MSFADLKQKIQERINLQIKLQNELDMSSDAWFSAGVLRVVLSGILSDLELEEKKIKESEKRYERKDGVKLK